MFDKGMCDENEEDKESHRGPNSAGQPVARLDYANREVDVGEAGLGNADLQVKGADVVKGRAVDTRGKPVPVTRVRRRSSWISFDIPAR